MNEIIVKPGVEISLGKRGENLARCAVFDISAWEKTYGDGTAHLLHQRNGDSVPYPCVIEVEDGKVTWPITETDVAVAGTGRAELQYFVGETRVKSATWQTRTERGLNNAGATPEPPGENWISTLLELGTETQENAQAAQLSAQSAQESAQSAQESALAASNSSRNAAVSASNAKASEALTLSYLEDAKTQAGFAEAAADEATEAMRAAEVARAAAAQSESNAMDAVERAKEFADGKVSKSGDTMTGNLKLQPYGDSYSVVKKNASSSGDYGLQMQDYSADGAYMGLTLSAEAQKIELKMKAADSDTYEYPELYHSKNPQTEVTGDYAQMNFEVTEGHRTTLMKNADSTNDYGTVLRDTNGDDVVELKLNAAKGSLKMAKDGKEYRVYTEEDEGEIIAAVLEALPVYDGSVTEV